MQLEAIKKYLNRGGSDRRPTLGDRVTMTGANHRGGMIVQDDGPEDSKPYKVQFDNGNTSWCTATQVTKVSLAKDVKYVWIDAQCMPQDHPKGSRGAEDTAEFKNMLAQINMLFLGTSVLILYDLSYSSRFWTQFEAWAAMQFATPDGLVSAVDTKNERFDIICIQNAATNAAHHVQGLINIWAAKTPQEAFEILSKPDITVTNQSDKDNQLPKIATLSYTVREAFAAVAEQLHQRVVAAEDEAAAAAAANAKAVHERAIAKGLMPLVMLRDDKAAAEAQVAAEQAAVEAKRARVEAWEKSVAASHCCCCFSGDEGQYIYRVVPTKYRYIMPCMVHLCLCPQQGCDPQCDSESWKPKAPCVGGESVCCLHIYSSLTVCACQSSPGGGDCGSL